MKRQSKWQLQNPLNCPQWIVEIEKLLEIAILEEQDGQQDL